MHAKSVAARRGALTRTSAARVALRSSLRLPWRRACAAEAHRCRFCRMCGSVRVRCCVRAQMLSAVRRFLKPQPIVRASVVARANVGAVRLFSEEAAPAAAAAAGREAGTVKWSV